MNTHEPALSIRTVRVKRLFGHLDYTLDFTSNTSCLDRLVILYGDNGCGKTTILNLLFHLLSPVDNKGHKSAVSRVKFEALELTLSNGLVISACRPRGEVFGNLSLAITREGQTLVSVTLLAQEDGTVSMPDNEGIGAFLKALSSIQLEILFMRDSRRFTSSIDDSFAEDEDDTPSGEYYLDSRTLQRIQMRKMSVRDVALQEAIEKVNKYFSMKALAASQQGAVDTNRVYDEIIKHLLKPRKTLSVLSDREYSNYIKRLLELRDINQTFVTVGLTTPLIPDTTIEQLKDASSSVRAALSNVVKPYIDGVAARLEALESIHRSIWRFQDTLNSFFTGGKAVSFTLKEGLRITGFGGSKIAPALLSSGEKQLLLMLCSIIATGDRSSIFIIDEPEISLNIKWQRRLVESLLEMTSDTPMQFIMASHSMELIVKHRRHVVTVHSGRPTIQS